METLFIILEGLGLITFLWSIFFIKAETPVASCNPRHWKPVWKQQENFRGPGYALQLIGVIWMLVSGIGLLILWVV